MKLLWFIVKFYDYSNGNSKNSQDISYNLYDLLAGIVVTRSAELSEKVRFIQNSTGGILGPQDSFMRYGTRILHDGNELDPHTGALSDTDLSGINLSPT